MTQQFTDFANKHNITVTSVPIDSRPGTDWDGDTPANHFACTVKMGDRLLWQGNYSKGLGHAASLAAKNKSEVMTCRPTHHDMAQFEHELQRFQRGTRFIKDAKLHKTLIEFGKRHCKPEIGEILYSLQSDILNCDQMYEDWAGDLGYDPDSRKGYKIWEECNNIRRGLRDALGPLFEQFEELEDE